MKSINKFLYPFFTLKIFTQNQFSAYCMSSLYKEQHPFNQKGLPNVTTKLNAGIKKTLSIAVAANRNFRFKENQNFFRCGSVMLAFIFYQANMKNSKIN